VLPSLGLRALFSSSLFRSILRKSRGSTRRSCFVSLDREMAKTRCFTAEQQRREGEAQLLHTDLGARTSSSLHVLLLPPPLLLLPLLFDLEASAT